MSEGVLADERVEGELQAAEEREARLELLKLLVAVADSQMLRKNISAR